MNQRVRPIDEALGLYDVSTGVNPSVWNVTRRFAITEWVGGGSYGQVCRGFDRDNANAPVVIKRIPDVFQTSEDALRILREVAILRRLDHPNIVKVVDILEPEPNTDPATLHTHPFHVLYVVFQDGGLDLKVWLEQKPRPHLSADTVRHLMKQMVGAVGYLHRCRVVHRDIKPANILIDPVTLTLRIADFGLSRVIEVSEQEEHQGHHHRVWNFERPRAPGVSDVTGEDSPVDADSSGSALPLQRSGSSGDYTSDDSDVEDDAPGLLVRFATPIVVTRWYRAPEVCLCRGSYSQAIDVFSMGCILAEMLHCMPPSASASSSSRVLFPGSECRSETKAYNLPVFANEMLGKFFAVLGKPSQEDVVELARAAGEAAVFKLPTTANASAQESTRRQAMERTVQLLTTGYATCQGISAPVDFSAKYSAAAAECPAALSLLVQMLAYSPSKRITCSEALRHEFLNPGHADVTVDGTVGDDGHERAKRTAVKLKQLNIEGLCHHKPNQIRDRAKISELLIAEAELIKLVQHVQLGGAAGHAEAAEQSKGSPSD